jgi:hypothetical protein
MRGTPVCSRFVYEIDYWEKRKGLYVSICLHIFVESISFSALLMKVNTLGFLVWF